MLSQVWHYCQLDGRHDRFLCSNGTLFDQKTRVCDWWYNVDCHSSVLKYGVNADLYREPTHKMYSPTHNPINKYQTHYKQPVPLQSPHPLRPIPVPLGYHHSSADLDLSGHGLVFAESQVVAHKTPNKKGIKRVRKIRLNKTNTTDSQSLQENKRSNKWMSTILSLKSIALFLKRTTSFGALGVDSWPKVVRLFSQTIDT